MKTKMPVQKSADTYMNDEQIRRMEHLLLEAYPPVACRDVQRLLNEEFGIEISIGAISTFYNRRSRELLLARTADARCTAEAFQQAMSEPANGQPPRLFETMLEIGAASALNPRFLAEDPTPQYVHSMIHLGALGLRAQNQAAMVRLRERALALREKRSQALHPTPVAEAPAPKS